MGKAKGYRPLALSSVVFGVLLFVTLALIGLIEYAARVLPSTHGGKVKRDSTLRGSFVVLKDAAFTDWQAATTGSVLAITELPLKLGPRAPLPQGTSAPNPNAYLNTKPTVTSTPELVYSTIRPSAPNPDAYLNTKSSSAQGTSAPPPNAYLNTKSTSAAQGTSAPNPNAYLNTKSTAPSGPAPNAYPNTPSSARGSSTAASSPNPNAYLNTGYSSSRGQSAIVSAPNPNAYLNSRSLASSASRATITSMTTVPPTQAPNPEGYFQTEPGPGAPAGKAYVAVSSRRQYFVGSYLPTLVAVLYAIPFIVIDRAIKAVEPFHHLSRPQGASAASTLTIDYSSALAPLHALVHQQWAVVVGSLIVLLSMLVTPLAPEAVAIRTIGDCNAKTDGCNGTLGISIPVARALQGALGLMAILILVLAFMVRRRTMVASEPISIAGVAMMVTNAETRSEFSTLFAQPTSGHLRRALRAYRYRLHTAVEPDGTTTTAIARISDQYSWSLPPVDTKHEYATLNLNQELKHAHRVYSSLFAIFLAGLATLIIVYHYTGGDTGFENFLSGQGFGVRFLFTFIGVLASLFWRHMFQEVALLAPYRRLAQRRATAQESILMTPPLHPVLAVHSALAARHYTLALISVSVVLSEVLTVTLSTIPFSSATLHAAYVASTWISVAIIGIMLSTLVFLFLYREPQLPVKPTTIAAKLVYLADSSLPYLLRTVSGLDTRARNARIRAMGLKYRLGMVQGYDGATKLVVDADYSGVS